MSAPTHPDIGVLGLVPDAWNSIWMPRQHVMTRIARHFHVVWSDPPREWREWLGVARPRPRALELGDEQPPPTNFQVFRPGRRFPLVYRPQWAARWLDRERLTRAAGLLRRRGARHLVLYLWQDQFAPALDLIDHDLSCYHIDDEYTFSVVDLPIPPDEARLLRRVDQVFVHSPGLLKKKGGLNPHTLLVPNGVDFAAYSRAAREPEDLRGIPHPRIGYVGVIKEHLDIPALLETARAHPEWAWVFVGPVRMSGGDLEKFQALQALPQVRYLGGKAVDALPAYMQALDVGLLPYRLTGYTQYIYPMKLHEYLAAGLAVVASPIRTLQEYGSAITLVPPGTDWGIPIATALNASTPDAVASRRAVAREHDWDRLVDGIADTIVTRLRERQRKIAR